MTRTLGALRAFFFERTFSWFGADPETTMFKPKSHPSIIPMKKGPLVRAFRGRPCLAALSQWGRTLHCV